MENSRGARAERDPEKGGSLPSLPLPLYRHAGELEMELTTMNQSDMG